MSELLYNGGEKSGKDPAITTLIVIPPESYRVLHDSVCDKTGYNYYGALPLL